MRNISKMNHISIGQFGENLGSAYLIKRGYKILGRNYRRKWDEIDIISRRKDGTIIFCEVKTLKGNSAGGLMPEDNLSTAKIKKLRRACQVFVGKHPELISDKKGWQIDLLAIVLKYPDGTGREPIIRHYENI